MDEKIRKILKKLSIALSDALSNSEEIKNLVQQLKENGYELILLTEIKVALRKEDAESQLLEDDLQEEDTQSREGMLDSKISPEDREFLRSIKIKIDE